MGAGGGAAQRALPFSGSGSSRAAGCAMRRRRSPGVLGAVRSVDAEACGRHGEHDPPVVSFDALDALLQARLALTPDLLKPTPLDLTGLALLAQEFGLLLEKLDRLAGRDDGLCPRLAMVSPGGPMPAACRNPRRQSPRVNRDQLTSRRTPT